MVNLTTAIRCLSCGEGGEGEYLRRPFGGRTGYHVWLRCAGCKGNARGAGQWVARQEVIDAGVNPDDLPEDYPDGALVDQGVLF